MAVRILTSPQDFAPYAAWVAQYPQGSLWQSLAWRDFQNALGRETRIYVEEENGSIVVSALVVIDKTSLGLTTWDIARGPLGSSETLLSRIIEDAKGARAMTVYWSSFSPISNLESRISNRHVHPEATRILDLKLNDEQLLAGMKPKGRYNIRLAEKHGVQVELSHDLQAFVRLAKETMRRDNFKGHSEGFYERFLTHLPGAFLLLAYMPREAVIPSSSPPGERIELAGLLGVIWGTTGVYYYGASSDQARNLMAPYLLQWEAMKLCRERGCTRYDLFGIAPDGSVNHRWAGVTDFKAKFGGEYAAYAPEQQIILRPFAKAALDLKRRVLG